MAVVSVRPIAGGRRGGIDEEITRRYYRAFVVITNDVNDGPLIVRLATLQGMPFLGQPYAYGNDADPFALCIDVQIHQVEGSPYVWGVTAEYSTKRRVPAFVENPLLRPPEIEWNKTTIQRPLTRDQYGNAIVSSANDPYDPAPERPESCLTLRFARNEAAFDRVFASFYYDTVNLDDFLGFGPRQARCESITASRQFENNIIFYKVTYEFHFRLRTWDMPLLDQGFRDYLGRQFFDTVTSAPLSYATLLDGRGRRLFLNQSYCSNVVNTGDPAIFGAVKVLTFDGSARNLPMPYNRHLTDQSVEQDGRDGATSRVANGPPYLFHWPFSIYANGEEMLVTGSDSMAWDEFDAQNTFVTAKFWVERGQNNTKPVQLANPTSVYLLPIYRRWQVLEGRYFNGLNIPQGI